MNIKKKIQPLPLTAAVLIPIVAALLQWLFWPAIRPYVWFLFYPAVFFSSRVGGLLGGLAATAISTAFVWWVFVPLVHTSPAQDPKTLVSVGLFIWMGFLFSSFHERLRKANRQAATALEESRNANDRLVGANEQITQLYEKTLELDKLKTQLFANVSHELRTPLTLILGPVGKLLEKAGLTDEERKDLKVVERNARMLYRHVSDLMDVAKLEAGRMEMRYVQADLAEISRYIASNFEAAAAEKKIRFSVRIPETLPAQVDIEKYRRILLNILSNAFKFSPDGGSIALTLRSEAERAVLQVMDNGPGIPESMREAVFERFSQVEGSSDRRYGGTGLGLAIVRELVELHKGSVSLTEAPGGGALFTVEVPLSAPAGIEIQNKAQAEPNDILEKQALDELRLCSGTAARPEITVSADAPLILVVEDNPDMNAYLVGLLGRHYRVASAFDGQEGISKAMALQPDLILSDVMMPRMSGDRMVEELRLLPEMSDVPIVMLTAKADDSLRVKMLKSGAQDYISKPFSDEEMLARVSGLVLKRRKSMAEILRLNAELEQRVLERTAELTAANRELDSFAYAVSHDLRAPLRAMSGFSNALMEDYGNELQGEARGYLEQIDIASCQMGQLIDGLLALSRSTRGELLRERVDISALSDRILSDFTEKEPARNVLRQVEQGLIVHGDSRMLEALMVNLLNNAWKYTSETAAPRIRVYSESTGTTRHICVADNGAGFDMRYADNLFKPFKRLHRQDEFPGIGIGLATAQRIVHRHGGVISADGRPGQGATFRFSLLS